MDPWLREDIELVRNSQITHSLPGNGVELFQLHPKGIASNRD